MSKVLQKILLALGVIAVIALFIEIGLSVSATTHGSMPVRVVQVVAGPYPLTVNMYQYPANAGFALPFAIVPQHVLKEPLTFDVSSIPSKSVSATPVRSSVNPDLRMSGGVQGVAELTVRGLWNLHIVVDGPSGHGEVNVPIMVTAPPAVPAWLGWLVGLIPIGGLLTFVLMQQRRQPALSALTYSH